MCVYCCTLKDIGYSYSLQESVIFFKGFVPNPITQFHLFEYIILYPPSTGNLHWEIMIV